MRASENADQDQAAPLGIPPGAYGQALTERPDPHRGARSREERATLSVRPAEGSRRSGAPGPSANTLCLPTAPCARLHHSPPGALGTAGALAGSSGPPRRCRASQPCLAPAASAEVSAPHTQSRGAHPSEVDVSARAPPPATRHWQRHRSRRMPVLPALSAARLPTGSSPGHRKGLLAGERVWEKPGSSGPFPEKRAARRRQAF